MDDLQAIRDVLVAPGPTDRATLQARALLVDAMDPARPAARGRRRSEARGPRRSAGWWHVSRWPVLRLSAAAAAVLAGLAIIVTATTVGTGGRRGHGTALDPAAHEILLAAASGAAEAPTGRYWHVEEIVAVGPYRVGGAAHPYDLVGRSVTENWVAGTAGDKSWEGYRQLGYRPRSAADERAWRADGSPTQWVLNADTTSGTRLSMAPGKAKLTPRDAADSYLRELGGFNLAQVQQLPTDPAQLRALFVGRITADGAASASVLAMRLFSVMGELLVDVPAPPKIRAAAFAVLAGLPGVRGVNGVTDSEGRTGDGVELVQTEGGFVSYERLLIDPATHLIIARDQAGYTDPAHPLKEGHSVVLKAEWTDDKPEPPTAT
jgi:hypothetical protein